MKVKLTTGFAGRLIAERQREGEKESASERTCGIKDDARAFGLSNRKDEVTI